MMELKGRVSKGCLVAVILCMTFYVGVLATMKLMQTPATPPTWQIDLPGSGRLISAHSLAAGRLAVITSDRVIFISTKGEISQEHAPPVSGFGAGGVDGAGNLYVGGDCGYVLAYSADGTEKWALNLADQVLADPNNSLATNCMVDDDGNVIVMVDTGEVALVSAAGEILQHCTFPFTFSSWVSPVRIGDSQVVFEKRQQSGGQELTAVDLAGNEIWANPLPGFSLESIDLMQDVLLTHTRHFGMYCYSLDGTQLWDFHNPDPSGDHAYHSFEGVSVSNDEIYYSSGGILFSLDHEGKINWQMPNKGVAVPMLNSENRVLFAEYVIPQQTTDSIRDFIGRYTPISLGYEQPSMRVKVVEAVNQTITQSWQMPNDMLVMTEVGDDGAVYGYTPEDSNNAVPLTLYRFDL